MTNELWTCALLPLFEKNADASWHIAFFAWCPWQTLLSKLLGEWNLRMAPGELIWGEKWPLLSESAIIKVTWMSEAHLDSTVVFIWESTKPLFGSKPSLLQTPWQMQTVLPHIRSMHYDIGQGKAKIHALWYWARRSQAAFIKTLFGVFSPPKC